jgi:Protein of unknown function (DUF4011)
LYCAVGFLEWYEPEDAPDPAYAPLMLLPINMDKRITNGEYVFSIAGRDDDEATNVALREKLKRLSVDLPEYDPEAGIEAYLESVAACLTNRPRWRVRRFATLGLFSFARQAMWRDLDSSRWPVTARPEGHLLLGQVYGDVAGQHTDHVAPIHDVDHPELEKQAPALITDADASQLSAVIDATIGKNLVIQGPPGTGKSQAITNIIANALWHGKTILFVSEKMAALKVVKDRLDHMGLGLYCLEVHSAKASKTAVLKAIRERMEYPRRIANMREIESAREALGQARQRLTEYAALMNSPAGSTGLTTHQVLWGDFTRATPEQPPPKAALEFRFPDPLRIDRFKLGELIGIGKALDDWAAGMGAIADPAHQPWRGVGNLNLNRFDRAKAVQVVASWSDALQGLLAHSERLSTTAAWDGLNSISDIAAALKVVTAIPKPEREVEETILGLAAGDVARHSLGCWADCCTRVHGLENQIGAICSRQALEGSPDAVGALMEKAMAEGVANLSRGQLPKAYEQARESAQKIARLVQLITELLQVAGRDPSLGLDVRSEAMAAGYLHAVHKIALEDLRYRSRALTDENAIEELGAAQKIAEEARGAAAEARFSDAPTSSFTEAIPSIQELRKAAGVLRSTGFFGKLFGHEWRAAKAVCRRTFPDERKLAPLEAAKRLVSAALWKESLQRLEACIHAKTAAGRHWNSVDTPFEKLISVAHWMRSIQRVTPLNEQGARELRRLAYESTADDFVTLARFAETAEDLNLVNAFQNAYVAKSTMHAEAERLAVRSAVLQWIIETVRQLDLQPQQSIEALTGARAASLEAKTLRERMKNETVAVNACAAMSTASELVKAKTIHATLRYIEKAMVVHVPASVSRYLLQDGCATRVTTLKQLAEEMALTLNAVRQASQDADALLKLRPEEWCGGSFDAVPIPEVLQKCRRAAQAPEALEKQIALLSTELEAGDLGLRDLIRRWPAEGLRYAGVAQAVEAAFYRSAAEKLMREHAVLTRHAGNTHEQVRNTIPRTRSRDSGAQPPNDRSEASRSADPGGASGGLDTRVHR